MTDVKSLRTNTLADGLIERASSMLDGTPSQLCTKKMVINRGGKNEVPNKVKPVKNTPSFLKTIPMEKEDFLHINSKAMHMSTRILSN